ncbi:MAG: ankyrin repeat domain-containing protein [Bryobacterales bacterium]|nr:ankyrin repeat domain-containing protein [Bryobacterales bacterium]
MTIHEACQEGDLLAVHQLLAADPSLAALPMEHDKTPLHIAAEFNHPMIVHLLLGAGAGLEPLTDWGMTPLDWAATMNSQAAAQVLLDRGAELRLYSAAGLGMGERVAGFAGDGLELGRGLYIACRNGHVDVAEALLGRGADINHRGFFGATGLHWAAANGHRETVEFLVARGADRTLEDTQFQATAQGWALELGHEDIAALLG